MEEILKRIEKLENLENLKNLEKLENLNKLNNLDKLNKLEKLDKLDLQYIFDKIFSATENFNGSIKELNLTLIKYHESTETHSENTEKEHNDLKTEIAGLKAGDRSLINYIFKVALIVLIGIALGEKFGLFNWLNLIK